MATPQWDNLPDACRSRPQWVIWSHREVHGRKTKVPLDAYGHNASTTAPHTWAHLDEVRKTFEAGTGAGVGFVFTRQAGISGIDLDHCRDSSTGEVDAWAQTIIAQLDSYTEISPSGAGVHILVKGSLPEGVDGKKKLLKGDGYRPDAALEIYSAGRYFTMTGNVLDGYPRTVEDRQDELLALYSEVFGPAEPDTHQTTRKAQDKRQDKPTGEVKRSTTTPAGGLSDEAVLTRMFGSANGDKIKWLHAGDTTDYGGDDSAADQALANHLAFWTGKDREQMDRIFRLSGLMRPKWDEKRGSTTYGERTIDEAIRGTTEVYQPERTEDTACDTKKPEKGKKGRPSTITRIAWLLADQFSQDPDNQLVITPTDKAYLWMSVGDHRQLFDLDSKEFRAWLSGLYSDRHQRAVLSSSAVRDNRDAIVSMLARIKPPQKIDLKIKTAMLDGEIFYDLGDEEWRCVRMSHTAGVEVVPAPLGLRRTKAQGTQAMPDLTATPADMDRLTAMMRITDKDDQLLIKAWICAGIVPDIPHPIMWMTGGQGSGKSMRAAMIKSILDPSVLRQTSLPDSRKDLGVLLANCHCLVLDNIDQPFTNWQVEMLCQSVTGGAAVARELFTDGDLAINVFSKGALVFTSIGVVSNAPDLLDRAILLPVPDLTEDDRRTEAAMWAEYEAARPKALGGVFKSIQQAMTILPSVAAEFERGEWPQQRMADFVVWGEALARAAWGKEPGEFLEAYRRRISQMAKEIVAGDLAMSTLAEFIRERIMWKGTTDELLRELVKMNRYEDQGWQPPIKGWPRTPNALGMKIQKYKTDLARQGIKIEKDRNKAERTIQIELTTRETPDAETEDAKIRQIIEDHERAGTPIKIREFAFGNDLDKVSLCRQFHARGWIYSDITKMYVPPSAQ